MAEVSCINNALIISTKKPNVKIVTGRVKKIIRGRIKRLMIDSTIAAIRAEKGS